MSFDDYLTEDRRLVLLRGLAASVQYRANAFLLGRYAAAVGHTVSADRLAADLAWLAEQGLVTLAKAEGVTVATLTVRGLDVAEGRARVPGVQQPQPGA
ncbi:MAG: ArsR family transcriptional regulator [Burkholderiaceae bacterium]|nr:ArsR family transcriptional regulator [Burkholderiaceae bacterium]